MFVKNLTEYYQISLKNLPYLTDFIPQLMHVCDCVCYHEIKGTEDIVKLQEDTDCLGCWARKWGMRFQPVKCNIMQITRKRIKKINAFYNLEGTVLDNVENIKYLGVTITNDLKWNTHVRNICIKANRTLGFLRRNLSAFSTGR